MDVFALLKQPPRFDPKPRRTPPVTDDAIDRISEQHNFPSRQAARPPKEPKPKRRRYRTGRDRQLNLKVTSETVERFYKMADERGVPLGALLERALDALDRAGGGKMKTEVSAEKPAPG